MLSGQEVRARLPDPLDIQRTPFLERERGFDVYPNLYQQHAD